ncbi:MAG: 1-acyl-sn-glycerol-3-phosphate acyltransferase [Bacteroidales bacterium]|nr:1-acyl-sn-glycerol-3-phosphate acyltransferase [Bacteroidales bacterium]
MAKRSEIDQYSIGYTFWRVFFARPAFRHYYRKLEIYEDYKLPKNEPVILAPNHQNALMDAMAFVAPVRRHQIIFFARADIFKKKAIAAILTFMKIMPVYRKRDGVSSLQKNDEIFDAGAQFLKNKRQPICLFPEGSHGDKRRLRQLVKGIFRIAFKAQEEYKDKPGVKIYPAGVDYGCYPKFRNTLLVQYGKPIEVSEYWEEYEKNNAVGINKLRERLTEEIKKYIIHIESEEYYDTYMGIRPFYNEKMRQKLDIKGKSLRDQFNADKKLIDALDADLEKENSKIPALQEHFQKYAKLRDKMDFRDWVFKKPKYSIIANLLFLLLNLIISPLAILGLVNNWPHFFIPPVISKNVKDGQFHSTFNWVLGLFMRMLYYGILILIALLVLPEWWMKLIYILTLWPTALVALTSRKIWIKSKKRILYTIKRKSKEIQEIHKQRNAIYDIVDSVVDEYLKNAKA